MIQIVRFLLSIIFLSSITIHADTRIKDIVNIEGVRDNLLVGYGLVVGLNGTGDNLNNSVFTQKGLTDFLEKLGVAAFKIASADLVNLPLIEHVSKKNKPTRYSKK